MAHFTFNTNIEITAAIQADITSGMWTSVSYTITADKVNATAAIIMIRASAIFGFLPEFSVSLPLTTNHSLFL
jgi:hypothetical protein